MIKFNCQITTKVLYYQNSEKIRELNTPVVSPNMACHKPTTPAGAHLPIDRLGAAVNAKRSAGGPRRVDRSLQDDSSLMGSRRPIRSSCSKISIHRVITRSGGWSLQAEQIIIRDHTTGHWWQEANAARPQGVSVSRTSSCLLATVALSSAGTVCRVPAAAAAAAQLDQWPAISSCSSSERPCPPLSMSISPSFPPSLSLKVVR